MILRDNQLVEPHYDLPLYDVGMRVIYGSAELPIEADVIGIELSCFVDAASNVITQIAYELDNNQTVLEEDISGFYDVA